MRDELDELNATSHTTGTSPRVTCCAQCGSSSGLRWAGWRAYRTDDPEFDEPPALAFFCPTCARAEFGRS